MMPQQGEQMPGLIPLILIIVPIVEIALFVQIGGQ